MYDPQKRRVAETLAKLLLLRAADPDEPGDRLCLVMELARFLDAEAELLVAMHLETEKRRKERQMNQ